MLNLSNLLALPQPVLPYSLFSAHTKVRTWKLQSDEGGGLTAQQQPQGSSVTKAGSGWRAPTLRTAAIQPLSKGYRWAQGSSQLADVWRPTVQHSSEFCTEAQGLG